jgi:hypothetical protein
MPGPLLCKECIVSQHAFNPLHRIQVGRRPSVLFLTPLTCCRSGPARFSGTKTCEALDKQSNWVITPEACVPARNGAPVHLLCSTPTDYTNSTSYFVNATLLLFMETAYSSSCAVVCSPPQQQTRRPEQVLASSTRSKSLVSNQSYHFMTSTYPLKLSPTRQVSLA